MVACRPEKTTLEIHSQATRCNLDGSCRCRGGGVLVEVELEDTKILWPVGVLYGGGETYENEVFNMMFERCHSKYRKRSLKHHMEHFNLVE